MSYAPLTIAVLNMAGECLRTDLNDVMHFSQSYYRMEHIIMFKHRFELIFDKKDRQIISEPAGLQVFFKNVDYSNLSTI